MGMCRGSFMEGKEKMATHLSAGDKVQGFIFTHMPPMDRSTSSQKKETEPSLAQKHAHTGIRRNRLAVIFPSIFHGL